MRSFASNRRGRLHADTRCRRGAQACIRDRLVPAVFGRTSPRSNGVLVDSDARALPAEHLADSDLSQYRSANMPHAASGPRPVSLLLSGPHVERAPFATSPADRYDVAIRAGDVNPGPKGVRWAQRGSTFGRKPAIHVPGNHGLFGGDRVVSVQSIGARTQ